MCYGGTNLVFSGTLIYSFHIPKVHDCVNVVYSRDGRVGSCVSFCCYHACVESDRRGGAHKPHERIFGTAVLNLKPRYRTDDTASVRITKLITLLLYSLFSPFNSEYNNDVRLHAGQP